jgi:hypothetical protein
MRNFREFIIDPERLRSKRIYLVVDEAHCIVHWSDFRKEYGKFAGLRMALGESALAFGTSATLAPALRKAILNKGPFKANQTFVNTTTDRPEIYLDVRFMEGTMTNMEDLHWLIPASSNNEDIQQSPQLVGSRGLRKCIVFFETREYLKRALTHLRLWLQRAGVSKSVAHTVIQPYYAVLPLDTKEHTLSEFAMQDSKVRMLLATDAVGMGIDIVGIELVVQYGGEKLLAEVGELTTLVQRLGRCARLDHETGAFVWIVPKWAKLPPGKAAPDFREWKSRDLTNIETDNMFPTGRGKRKSKHPLSQVTNAEEDSRQNSYEAKRERLHPFYQLFLWDCPRRALLKAFHTHDSALWSYPEYNNQKCCSFEHPEYRPMNFSRYTVTEHVEAINKSKAVEAARVIEADVNHILLLPPQSAPKGSDQSAKVFGPLMNKLKCWREEVFRKMFPYNTGYSVQWFCPDTVITRIASISPWLMHPQATTLLAHFVPEFEHHDQFGDQIVTIVRETYTHIGQEPVQGRRAYFNEQKSRERAEQERHLAVRREKRQARYGAKLPTSELPGDEVDRLDSNRKKPPVTGMSQVLELVGRANNEAAVAGDLSDPFTPARKALTLFQSQTRELMATSIRASPRTSRRNSNASLGSNTTDVTTWTASPQPRLLTSPQIGGSFQPDSTLLATDSFELNPPTLRDRVAMNTSGQRGPSASKRSSNNPVSTGHSRGKRGSRTPITHCLQRDSIQSIESSPKTGIERQPTRSGRTPKPSRKVREAREEQ